MFLIRHHMPSPSSEASKRLNSSCSFCCSASRLSSKSTTFFFVSSSFYCLSVMQSVPRSVSAYLLPGSDCSHLAVKAVLLVGCCGFASALWVILSPRCRLCPTRVTRRICHIRHRLVGAPALCDGEGARFSSLERSAPVFIVVEILVDATDS